MIAIGENTDDRRLLLDQTTAKVIGSVHEVSNVLGAGFLEKVYENALAAELRLAGLHVIQQYPIEVRYKGIMVGDYVADLMIENSVLIEVKAFKSIEDIHTAQCMNYLRATGFPVCLLVNFGAPKAQVKSLSTRPQPAAADASRNGTRSRAAAN